MLDSISDIAFTRFGPCKICGDITNFGLVNLTKCVAESRDTCEDCKRTIKENR